MLLMISAACPGVHYCSAPHPEKGEDAGFSVSLSPEDVAGLTDDEISTALRSAFAMIQRGLLDRAPSDTPVYGGSTAVVALMVGEKTFIANSGDSIAMVLKEDEKIEVPFRHSFPEHRSECIPSRFMQGDRHFLLQEKNNYLCVFEYVDTEWQVRAGLEPTKGFGDLWHECFFDDWSDPDITIVPRSKRVVLATDGIDKAYFVPDDSDSDESESGAPDVVYYNSLDNENLVSCFSGTLKVEDVATVPGLINQLAQDCCTWDDVLVIAADPEPDAVKLFGVFDGHGGKVVAQYAATSMGNAVYQQLALQQEKRREKQAFIAAYDERSSAMSLYAARAKAKATARRATEATP